MNELQSDVNRLHHLLATAAVKHGGAQRLCDCGSAGWPERGVYFFFDDDEPCDISGNPRIVRVGTHGLHRGSRSTVWGRLRQHRGPTQGTTPGAGNHRGSVFRRHVGAALIVSGQWAPDVPTWGTNSSADPETRKSESDLERTVGVYIGALQFLVVPVLDDPSPSSQRGFIERNAIALLGAAARAGLVAAGEGWLGLHSDRCEIRASALWNVNHVNDEYDRAFLDAIERSV